jgi:hypothetical protein
VIGPDAINFQKKIYCVQNPEIFLNFGPKLLLIFLLGKYSNGCFSGLSNTEIYGSVSPLDKEIRVLSPAWQLTAMPLEGRAGLIIEIHTETHLQYSCQESFCMAESSMYKTFHKQSLS